MFRTRIIFSAVSVSLLILQTVAARATSYPLTLADDLGVTITLARRPSRIISLAPNVTEILFAIGAGDRVVGVTRYCNYPPEAERLPRVAGYTDVNVERIVSLSPDLVVANRGNPRRLLERLSHQGLTVLAIGPRSVEDVVRAISLIGHATDAERQAAEVCRDMARTLESVRKAVAGVEHRRRVYFGRLSPPYNTAGPSSFIGGCIALAGGDNIATGVTQPWLVMSVETILAGDPEIIIEGFHAADEGVRHRERLVERLRDDRVWSRVTAVRTGRVYTLDEDRVHRPGPRIARAVAEMARLFYPERFAPNGPAKPR